jgi:GntR family transcriptional regulator
LVTKDADAHRRSQMNSKIPHEPAARPRSVPLYLSIADTLAQGIASGEFPPYARLSSESALMRRFSVSRVTVRAAITRLVQQGLVHVRQGKGTFVAGPVVRQPLNGTSSLHTALVEHGFKPDRRLLEFRPATAREREGTPFATPGSSPPLLLRRLLLLHGKPCAYINALVASDVGTVTRQEVATHTLQSLLQRHPEGVAQTEVAVGARPAPREVASLLGLPRRRAVLVMTRSSRSRSGRVLDHTVAYVVPEAWEFVITLVREPDGRERVATRTSLPDAATARRHN